MGKWERFWYYGGSQPCVSMFLVVVRVRSRAVVPWNVEHGNGLSSAMGHTYDIGQWLSGSVSEDLLEMVKLVWVGDVQHGCSGFDYVGLASGCGTVVDAGHVQMLSGTPGSWAEIDV
jgi:hypothetical protein